MKPSLRRMLTLALALAPLPVTPARAQAPDTEYEGAAALGLALRRLGTTKRVLMVGAHPDDENTQVLTALAIGQGAEVAYLSLTRGEGGQNSIGPELGEALGLLRTEELLAARRLDGARQFFTRAYDYGFSKNAAEAFRHWPRDTILGDVVATVRAFRPDVIISVWSGTPRDGHGQHEASGLLAREAYEAAADPARFPQHAAAGLRPHAARKLYLALWTRDEGGAADRLPTGQVDPLLGRSHFQVAMASRSRHRSQDMGRELTAGPQSSGLQLVADRASEGGATSLFAGVDTTLVQEVQRLPAGRTADAVRLLGQYEARVEAMRGRFNPLRPDALVPELAGALRLLDEACAAVRGAEAWRELSEQIDAERAELASALALAARVRVDAISETETVVPGGMFEVTLTVWNGGTHPVELRGLAPELAAGWKPEAVDPAATAVPANSLVRRRFRVTIPADAQLSEPYFLRAPRRGDLYQWPADLLIGRPFDPPVGAGAARIEVAGAEIHVRQPITFRAVDKVQGELRRPLRVVPAVSVSVEPALLAVPVGAAPRPLRFRVRLRSDSPAVVQGTLVVQVPQGWTATPAALPVRFAGPGEVRVVELELRPGQQPREREYPLRVAFQEAGGGRYTRGYSLVDYPHVDPRPLFHPAEATLRGIEVRLPRPLRVGYVAGPGDEVPIALEQLGVQLELLGPGQLASADLSAFDAVVTGIRAYETRADLVTHNRRLLDYVRDGGTMIVQYNKYEFTDPGIAPYPVQMARPHDRVTDEGAPVRLLLPDHPALSWPNRITERDFDGWQQERGLYFLSHWDERFVPLLEMADPGEPAKRGVLMVAPYGKGTYVYTGLALFRQLPAGVPGAYRLFANLLSLGVRK